MLVSQLENALSQDIGAMEDHLFGAIAGLGKLVDKPGSSLKTRSIVDIHLVKLGLKLVDGIIGVWSLADAVHKFSGGFALFKLAAFLLTSSLPFGFTGCSTTLSYLLFIHLAALFFALMLIRKLLLTLLLLLLLLFLLLFLLAFLLAFFLCRRLWNILRLARFLVVTGTFM